MKNLFNSIQLKKPPTNVFDLTHDVKLSCNMGQLVPTMVTECVPGDRFTIGCESLLRFAPLVSPVMHRMDVTMHYWFVPNRILWDGWEEWITGRSTAEFPVFQLQDDGSNYTDLMDYMGIPPLPTPSTMFSAAPSALPFAAYQAIYNEYYRDQNLITEVDYALIDGDNSANTALSVLRKRAWEHDYFTSALPTAQAGSPVDIPLGDVRLKTGWGASGFQPTFDDAVGNTPSNPVVQDVFGGNPDIEITGAAVPHAYNPRSTLETTPTTINDLRRAYRLQEWLERSLRTGRRYAEAIFGHFGVKPQDARLSRPEYITGTKSPVVISEVLNTTGTVDAPQGEMAGHGISVTSGKYGGYFCQEHGYIIGIMSVMPKTAYQQGIPRHFLKTTDPFQFYWPEFANIGEQEVTKMELFAYHADSELVFGYVPRYAEYKFENSRVAGDFRTSLDFWHLGRIFSSIPSLNQQFVEMNSTAADRVFAVTTADVQKLYCHILHKVKAVRPMPKFGTPTF